MAFSIYGNGVVQKRENVLFLGEGKGCVAVCFVCYHIRNFWSVLTLGNSMQTHYKVKLTIDGIPEGTTLITDAPEYIDVSVRNNGYAFVRYMVGAIPEVLINFGRFADGKGRVVLAKQNIEDLLREAFGKDASIDAFSPEQLELRYTTNPGKKCQLWLMATSRPTCNMW